DIKDLGMVMRTLIPEFKGRADNGQIKNLVIECLK
ncbi:MAG: GatB/YqeY domain-containing protein, partial [Nitrospina sp.]|nr:GatB/YqeY domain-containing protein [Nitrospina sp.]